MVRCPCAAAEVAPSPNVATMAAAPPLTHLLVCMARPPSKTPFSSLLGRLGDHPTQRVGEMSIVLAHPSEGVLVSATASVLP